MINTMDELEGKTTIMVKEQVFFWCLHYGKIKHLVFSCLDGTGFYKYFKCWESFRDADFTERIKNNS